MKFIRATVRVLAFTAMLVTVGLVMVGIEVSVGWWSTAAAFVTFYWVFVHRYEKKGSSNR